VYILKKIAKKTYFRIFYDVAIGSNADVGLGSSFEGFNKIGKNSYFQGRMGLGSYIANNCTFPRSSIGRFSCVGPGSGIAAGEHPTTRLVSIHPAFYSSKNSNALNFSTNIHFEEYRYGDFECNYYAVIGHDVWIAANVTIINGISIADGTIVLPGAVVRESIEAFGVYGGIPAKKLKYRFSERERGDLLKIKWWNWDLQTVRDRANDFSNVLTFTNIYR
jgi:acetyltransferase-like isoleucine patch superfamily enzyme